MRQRYSLAFLALTLLALAPGGAQAVTLWDQSTIVPAGPGIPASHSSGFGGFVVHTVEDVTVPASGWVVTKITQWYSGSDQSWVGGMTTGYVNVYPKTGPLPTAANTASAVLVPMAATFDAVRGAQLGQTVIMVTCNVNLNLPAGDYWIGITPRKSISPLGANRMWPSAMVGAPVALLPVPGAWGNDMGNWDGAFLIEGELPVPAESQTWGSVKGLYR